MKILGPILFTAPLFNHCSHCSPTIVAFYGGIPYFGIPGDNGENKQKVFYSSAFIYKCVRTRN